MVKQDTYKRLGKQHKIIIIYPGYNGTMEGYNGKYNTIAEILNKKYNFNVVQSSNMCGQEANYSSDVQNWLRHLIINELCEWEYVRPIEIYLMGVSAGASACAMVAYEFPEVTKMLLIAPSTDAIDGDDGESVQDIYKAILQYKGHLYVTVGEQDEIVGNAFPRLLSDCATNAIANKFVEVPNCDHQFRGETNGKIFSKSPLWAFCDDNTYPSPEGGIKLYD